MKTYYDILELNLDASSKEIKSNFRKLAKKYHPDANTDKDSEEIFKEINEAYNTLIDDNERAEYDFFLKAIGEYKRHYTYKEEKNETNKKKDKINKNDGYDEDQEDEDLDIEMTIRIDIDEAKNGCYKKIKIEELNKEYKVHIPAGTKNKDKIKLKGQGYSSVINDTCGDIILKVLVTRIYAPVNTDTKYQKAKNYENTVEEDDSEESLFLKVGAIIGLIIIAFLAIAWISDSLEQDRSRKQEINNYLKQDVYKEIDTKPNVKNNNTNNDNKTNINKETQTKTNSNLNTQSKPSYIDPNPYKNYTGGYNSSKNGVYNYIKIFPTSSETIYVPVNQDVIFDLVGYNPNVSISGQVIVYRNGYYQATYYSKDEPSNDGTIRKWVGFRCLSADTYKASVSMSDGLGGWTGKEYTIVAYYPNNNNNIYKDIYRDIYRY